MSEPKKGDKVTWNTPQGKTSGTVTKKVTSDTSADGTKATAGPKDPQFEVQSKSGKKAIHKPESLKKK